MARNLFPLSLSVVIYNFPPNFARHVARQRRVSPQLVSRVREITHALRRRENIPRTYPLPPAVNVRPVPFDLGENVLYSCHATEHLIFAGLTAMKEQLLRASRAHDYISR